MREFYKREKEHTALDTALLAAVKEGCLEKVKDCLSIGADVNVCGEDSVTPLHDAAVRGRTGLVSLLLEHPDIQVDHRSQAGTTPLHEAIASCNLNVALLLMKYGASIRERDSFGNTSLHIAVLNDCESLVIHLIYKGSDVNAVNIFEETPLHITMLRTQNPEIARILLDNGASPSPQIGTGLPLLSTMVLGANSPDHLGAIRLLIQYGADVNEVEAIGLRTPLHIVAMTGYMPVAEFLIQKNARVLAANVSGKTPICTAILHKNWELAIFLTKVITSKTENENMKDTE